MDTERVLGIDWVVRHENRLYLVERQRRHHATETVDARGGADAGSPLAQKLSGHATTAGDGRGGRPAFRGPGLHSALNARPSASQGFAPAGTTESHQQQRQERGHF